MKSRKKGYKPRRNYYDPSTQPQPRKNITGPTSAIVAKNSRQLRRAQQRGG